MVVNLDGQGRDLEATLQGDGFVWELWVDIKTKDAVVRKRFPDNSFKTVSGIEIPKVFEGYEKLLQDFVKKQK